jgi:C-terminal processing protease CtpA/Prc
MQRRIAVRYVAIRRRHIKSKDYQSSNPFLFFQWERRGEEMVEAMLEKAKKEAAKLGIQKMTSADELNTLEEFDCGGADKLQPVVDCNLTDQTKPSSSSESSSEKGDLIRMTVIAPAGTLGITIDTTSGSPIVEEVLATSPLRDSFRSGDHIVEIDGVDTRNMRVESI